MFKLDKGILKALKSTILISLPALLLFLYVRYALGFINYLSWETISNIILYHLSSLSLFNSPYPAFGTLWIIALLNLSKNNNPFIKKTIYLLPLIIMQLFIATDTYRLLFLAFPIIIPLSLYLNINENTKRILMLLILSIIILISYSVFFNVSTIPNILILIFLPLEILITGFLLILLYKKNLINKK
ncbi:MAG: hypothetical protein LLF83_05460 [Methanobacterium sp.]|nr:hypothetical protein [Methanobacterium sp.]